jgi:hypothetical protein
MGFERARLCAGVLKGRSLVLEFLKGRGFSPRGIFFAGLIGFLQSVVAKGA